MSPERIGTTSITHEVFDALDCPFPSCLAEDFHSHLVCPDCGAVRFGNLYCQGRCRQYIEAIARP